MLLLLLGLLQVCSGVLIGVGVTAKTASSISLAALSIDSITGVVVAHDDGVVVPATENSALVAGFVNVSPPQFALSVIGDYSQLLFMSGLNGAPLQNFTDKSAFIANFAFADSSSSGYALAITDTTVGVVQVSPSGLTALNGAFKRNDTLTFDGATVSDTSSNYYFATRSSSGSTVFSYNPSSGFTSVPFDGDAILMFVATIEGGSGNGDQVIALESPFDKEPVQIIVVNPATGATVQTLFTFSPTDGVPIPGLSAYDSSSGNLYVILANFNADAAYTLFTFDVMSSPVQVTGNVTLDISQVPGGIAALGYSGIC